MAVTGMRYCEVFGRGMNGDGDGEEESMECLRWAGGWWCPWQLRLCENVSE